MRLDRMPNWLKALVVLAALMGGVPSAAWAHAGHDHGNASPGSRQSASSNSGATDVRVVVASPLERPNRGGRGALGACCCQGMAPSCPSSSSGSPVSGVENQTAWDLAAVIRRSKVIRGPDDGRDYAAPPSRLDRPPKARPGWARWAHAENNPPSTVDVIAYRRITTPVKLPQFASIRSRPDVPKYTNRHRFRVPHARSCDESKTMDRASSQPVPRRMG